MEAADFAQQQPGSQQTFSNHYVRLQEIEQVPCFGGPASQCSSTVADVPAAAAAESGARDRGSQLCDAGAVQDAGAGGQAAAARSSHGLRAADTGALCTHRSAHRPQLPLQRCMSRRQSASTLCHVRWASPRRRRSSWCCRRSRRRRRSAALRPTTTSPWCRCGAAPGPGNSAAQQRCTPQQGLQRCSRMDVFPSC